MIKTLLKLLAAVLLIIIAIVLINTFRVGKFETQPITKELINIDTQRANRLLSEAIQIKTISTQNTENFNAEPFQKFITWMQSNYPLLHAQSKRQFFSNYSMLFTLTGSDTNLKPAIFTAHHDVVPAREDADSGWEKPPFSGVITDGFIWGRGTVDDKSSVVGLLEATEHLLSHGFKPKRTLMFAFGHDEEIGGRMGAVKIAEYLKSNSIQAEFLLDEGGLITRGIVGGTDRPVANINGSEKGYATFTLSTTGTGGHSSMPPPSTAVARIAAAINKINTQRLPSEITPPVQDMLSALAPAVPFGQRLVMSNTWLTEPLLLNIFAGKKTTNAMVNTTVAPTVFNAGDKENVLPREASAKINFRLLPGTTVEQLQKHIEQVIDDREVSVSLGEFYSNPPAYSDSNNPVWDLLVNTTAKHFPDTVITPGLTVGATDARHYVEVSDYQYRFLPIILTADEISGFHGKNERLSIENWHRMIRWYIDILQASGEAL